MGASIPVELFDTSKFLPAFAHAGDAGLDLRSTETVTLDPFERATISCGFAMSIPSGYAGLVIPRSGLASKHGISIVNAPGLIDSGYRGEIKVVLVNLDAEEAFDVNVGDRIAQLVVIKTPDIELEIVDSLEDSQRGCDGFGSSGVQ